MVIPGGEGSRDVIAFEDGDADPSAFEDDALEKALEALLNVEGSGQVLDANLIKEDLKDQANDLDSNIDDGDEHIGSKDVAAEEFVPIAKSLSACKHNWGACCFTMKRVEASYGYTYAWQCKCPLGAEQQAQMQKDHDVEVGRADV